MRASSSSFSLSSSLSSFFVVIIGFGVLGAGCASTTQLTLPSCAEQFEVEGQHDRRGPRTLTFDHGGDAPWTYTQVVVDDKNGGPQQTIRFNNTTPDGGRLVVGSMMALIGGAFATIALVDMSDGRVADYGPFYALGFGGAAAAAGTTLVLTGWGPGNNINLERLCSEQR